jgi:1-acyl-sn-glycerol-3-phosphate acyltransferase
MTEAESKSHPADKGPSAWLANTVKAVLYPFFRVFWRIKYHQVENIPHDLPGGLIIAANHQTYLDPFWLSVPVKRPLRFMAWDKACGWFIIGPLIKKLGAFPVNVEHGGVESFKTAIRILKRGDTLVIFPEGTREFADGKLLPMKPGTVRIAVEAGVPILPVTIRGGNRVWSQEKKLPRLGKVDITYHPLLEVSHPENMTARVYAEQLTDKLEEIIDSVKD